MKTITYYKTNGEVVESKELDNKTIKGCHGMKVRCTLLDGGEKVGFANTYYCMETGEFVVGIKAEKLAYIVLETFVNLDEETHKLCGDEKHRYDVSREKVAISEIAHIYAILHSGLRWGTKPTNKFTFTDNKQK